jgi:hypothetical protein
MREWTVVVQIGNSDDMLSQEAWARYVRDVGWAVGQVEKHRHFFGVSAGDAEWQNACWVIEMGEDRLDELKRLLNAYRDKYKQHSIALTVGDTEFIHKE